jgi:oxygen-independent coproporphyrinogen-3 oxidase
VVEEACNLDVDEIQLYRLKIDAYGDYQGPIKQVLEKHKHPAPTNEDAIVMKQMAIDILGQHGYRELILRRVFTRNPEHYSHYAHNQCCRLVDEVGFGLTAFSSLRDRFVLNTANFDEYYAKIESGHLPVNRGLVRSTEDKIRWAVVLPLKNRTIRNMDFRRITGRELKGVFTEKFNLLKEAGLVEDTRWGLTLTTLGCFFADEIVQQFFEPEHLPFAPEEYSPGPLHPLKNVEIFGEELEAAE